MQTYIALLRGINVSGQKKIKMATLREQLAAIGLKEVKTYIQSGNILFRDADKSNQHWEQLIHDMLLKEYGFEVPVMVRRPEDFSWAIEHNPFFPEKDPKRLYITFLDAVPEPEKVAALQAVDYQPEEYTIEGQVVFFFSPSGYGRAKMNNNFFEKKLKVAATTRNWRSVNILRDMASEYDT